MIENLQPRPRGSAVESKNLHDIEVMANEPTVDQPRQLDHLDRIARASQRYPSRAV